MDYTLAEKYEYIPEWNDNKNSKSPITFKCSYLTNEEFDQCFTIGSNGLEVDRKKLFKLSVDKIENLSVKGKGIFTPVDFLKLRGFGGLYTEVTTDMIAKNNEEPGKNSLQPST